MSLGSSVQNIHRPTNTRVGALSLFTLAGLVVGLGATVSSAQSTGQTTAQATGQAAASTANVKSDTAHNSADNVIQGKPLMLKLDGKASGMQFIVENPTWRESKAVRVLDPNRPHLNIVRTVYSELLVSVDSEEVLKRAIDSVGAQLGTNRPGSHTFRPFLGKDNVFVVQGNSVEDAANLANELTKHAGVNWAELNYQSPMQNLGGVSLNDPSLPNQWHIQNLDGVPGSDHKINLVHDRGFSGAGVVVGVQEADQNSFFHVDLDGNTQIHPDLANQLNEELSVPTAPLNISYSHGVSVSGLIAAEGDNGLAGVGVAYGAQLASLRNGNQIDSGESFGHELNRIHITNNSWGPVNESFPTSSTGKYIAEFPDNYEIDIPQVTHAGIGRSRLLGLDQSIRLGRGRKGRLNVFAAGNGSHFQGFDRLATGNAISLPGFGTDDMVPEYGYLDITGVDPSQEDADFDGIPDVFILDGTTDTAGPQGGPWRWSGHLGDRVEYNQMASWTRTFAIGAVGEDNTRTGYSTTGTSVFASAYVQILTQADEFTPDPGGGWGPALFGRGLTTLEQEDGADSDAPFDCNADLGISFVDDDLESCLFNGTSSAAPVAAGIMALMLEANPDLSIRDVQHILQQTSNPVGYDATHSYWPSLFLGLGQLDPDDNPNDPTPTFWTTNSADVRHSDEFGFGVIDADAAVAAAETWSGVDQLFVLDSGIVEAGEEDDDGGIVNPMIPDAVFEERIEINENLATNVLIPGERQIIPMSCIRDNMVVEGVELTLTIEGVGAGDLLIALRSPRGTISPLALPRGDSNGLGEVAYNDYTFSTYKHWGELSGGTWDLIIQDFRPDEESPEGDVPDEDPSDPPEPSELGLEQVTFLGTFGLPGNPDHDEKEIVSYRLKVFGTDQGDPVFQGCPPGLTSCPGDLDGNGFIDTADLQIYIAWFLEGNPFADLDGDGTIGYTDLTIYRSFWIPGFCGNANGPFIGGRPHPGGSDIRGDNDPVIRPF